MPTGNRKKGMKTKRPWKTRPGQSRFLTVKTDKQGKPIKRILK